MSKIVFYYTQKEPGSDLTHPDCFTLDKNDSVTIGDVLSAFPLSRFGNYHIRFRRNTTTSYEWIEPQEVDDPCPTYNGGIFLKVLNLDKMERGITRIPIEESIPEENMEIPPDEETDTLNEDPLDFDFGAPETAPSAETIHSPAETSSAPSKDVASDIVNDVVNDEPEPLRTSAPATTVIAEAPVDLKYVSKEDVVLDDNASKFTGTSYEGKSKSVVAAMKERERQLYDKQVKAVMEKREREIEKEVKEAERDEAKKKYGPILDKWAYDLGGAKKNIRTLLTTMHTVMWEGSNFTPISISQILTPDKVKTYYRKAMLKVHPDKVAGGTSEQIYIAGRIFDALNDAWATFQEQEKASDIYRM
ncbi:hypothetical protein WA538_001659, partial [Blastocystis sp. DL]